MSWSIKYISAQNWGWKVKLIAGYSSWIMLNNCYCIFLWKHSYWTTLYRSFPPPILWRRRNFDRLSAKRRNSARRGGRKIIRRNLKSSFSLKWTVENRLSYCALGVRIDILIQGYQTYVTFFKCCDFGTNILSEYRVKNPSLRQLLLHIFTEI